MTHPVASTRIAAALLAALAFVAAGCAGEQPASPAGEEPAAVDDAPTVVATTDVLADVVAQIAGDAAEVTALIPPGIDPHRFAPSTRDATRLREADLVIANGLGLEGQLADTLAAAEEDGVAVLHLAEELDPLPAGGHEDEAHEGEAHQDETHDDAHEDDAQGGDGHDHGEFDPHVWLDPLRMADAAGIVASRLAEIEGEGGLTDEEWTERGEAYAAELRAVHEEISDIVAALPQERRQLVADHDSLRYFAERYGFDVVGTFLPGISTEAQPSTRAIADLAARIEEHGIPAVFVDSTGENERLAQTLAAEVGGDVEVVPVYTGGLGEEGSGAETLVGMLRTNATRIVDALSRDND